MATSSPASEEVRHRRRRHGAQRVGGGEARRGGVGVGQLPSARKIPGKVAARFAPASHSYVRALDFVGPRELAGFLLALRRDEARYASYLAWKRARPVALSPGFVDAIRRDGLRPDRGSAACRLCSLVVNGTADLNLV